MPVTAKLSKRFYDTFGDEISDDLVDWFNQVDATYRQELREQNDLNWARVEARIGQTEASLRSDFEVGLERLRSDLLKWMFLFWTGSALTVIGLVTAVGR